MGLRQAGEGVIRVAVSPLGLGEEGTNFSWLPSLLPRPDSIVMVILSSFVLMLTIVGSGDSHLGIVIMESAGGGFTTETMMDSEDGASFLDGGGGNIP